MADSAEAPKSQPETHVPPTAENSANNNTTEAPAKVPEPEKKVETAAEVPSTKTPEKEKEKEKVVEKKSSGFFGMFQKKKSKELTQKQMWEKEEKLTLEERRARYYHAKFITNEEIPTWKQVAEKKGYKTEKGKYEVREDLNAKIGMFHGDITTLEIDAIVNAANESCLGGGGIDGAIHRAAGRELYEECLHLNGCNTGSTKITRGYDLPAKYVLHTVGPIGQRETYLKSCYETCLELVLKYNLRTVAFCGVSTGIFGYPLYPASRVALMVIREWLEKGDNKDKVDKIIICTFLDKEKVCYRELLTEYFPLPKKEVPAVAESNVNPAPESTSAPKEVADDKESLSTSVVFPASLSTSNGQSGLPKETLPETAPQDKKEEEVQPKEATTSS